MNSNNSVPYHKAGREYVEKLIRMHKALIQKGENTSSLAPGIVDQLSNLLSFWKYDSAEKMASFIYRHAAEIMYLIPGSGSNAHQSLMDEFSQLHEMSEQIMNHEPVC